MKDKKKALYLYEALELRSEYDARIKTLKDCLPESKQNKDRFSLLINILPILFDYNRNSAWKQ